MRCFVLFFRRSSNNQTRNQKKTVQIRQPFAIELFFYAILPNEPNEQKEQQPKKKHNNKKFIERDHNKKKVSNKSSAHTHTHTEYQNDRRTEFNLCRKYEMFRMICSLFRVFWTCRYTHRTGLPFKLWNMWNGINVHCTEFYWFAVILQGNTNMHEKNIRRNRIFRSLKRNRPKNIPM